MTTLFSFSMDTIMHVMVGIFLVVTIGVGIAAFRNRLFFKLGLRNIPRRKAQSALIVFGLMLGTVIITSAFATGDTISYSVRTYGASHLGTVDEIVTRSTSDHRKQERGAMPGIGYFSSAVVSPVESHVTGSLKGSGVMGIIAEPGPLQDLTSRQSKAQSDVVGLPGRYPAAFDPLVTISGARVTTAQLRPNQAYVNQQAAHLLNAHAGDHVRIFVAGHTVTAQVRAVLRDQGVAAGGLLQQGLGSNPVTIMPLPRLQSVLSRPGQITMLLVSNRGDLTAGAPLTSRAKRAIFAGLPPLTYTVATVKKDALDAANRAGSEFTAGFITFGLFSIASGVILIFLIFIMLAAERRTEMGIARAVGTRRRHLIQQFLFEGYAYDLGAALVGAALGVAVALAMVTVLASLLGQQTLGFSIQSHIEPRSLAVAFCLGALVTFLTVAGSAWWVSRMNIVAAIRDLPENLNGDSSIAGAFRKPLSDLHWFWLRLRRKHVRGSLAALAAAPWHLVLAFRVFITRGPVLLAAGYILLQMGSSDKQAFPFDLGISLLLIGAAMLLRWLLVAFRMPDRVRNRIGYTLAGVALVVFWLLPLDFVRSDLQIGIEMFFLAGLMIILGGVWAVMYNVDLIVGALLFALSRVQRLTPILRTALTYPTQHRLRTGLTIFMFSLVMFALMVQTVIIGSFSSEGLNLNRDTGGFAIYGVTPDTSPISNLNHRIAASPDLRGRIAGAGSLTSLPVDARQSQDPWNPYTANIVDTSYLQSTRFSLASRAAGYAADGSVWQALRAHPGYAVVDSSLVPSGKGASVSGSFAVRGIYASQRTFQPVHLQMRDARNGHRITLTIIGVLKPPVFQMDTSSGIYTSRATLVSAGDAPPAPTYYFFRPAAGQNVHKTALAVGSTFLPNGLDVREVQDQFNQNMAINVGFNNLLLAFMALGLIVGIAALGVIAMRATVERRQQIGMLRAIGFQRSMVRSSFLLESSFVSLLGTGIGMSLGLLLGHQVVDYFGKSDPSLHAAVPWLQVAAFGLVTYLAALATTWLPAWQASRVYPAEALRYE